MRTVFEKLIGSLLDRGKEGLLADSTLLSDGTTILVFLSPVQGVIPVIQGSNIRQYPAHTSFPGLIGASGQRQKHSVRREFRFLGEVELLKSRTHRTFYHGTNSSSVFKNQNKCGVLFLF